MLPNALGKRSIISLIKNYKEAISVIFSNPDLIGKLNSWELLEIMKINPSTAKLIYSSEDLLNKIKFEFNKLPPEIRINVSSFLTKKDLNNLKISSKEQQSFFKSSLKTNDLPQEDALSLTISKQ